MKKVEIFCPRCKEKILIGIPEKDDNVNGIEFDAIYIDNLDDTHKGEI